MKKFVEYMRDRCIPGDADDILQLVGEYLEDKADETLMEEPYATNTAQRYRDAAREVFDILYDE